MVTRQESVIETRAPQKKAAPTTEAEARAALREAPYEPVRRVQCATQGGVVVLTGRVPSFYLKQVAQCVIKQRLNGAASIDNRIEVGPPREKPNAP